MTNGHDHEKAKLAQDKQAEKPRAKESKASGATADQQKSAKKPNKKQ